MVPQTPKSGYAFKSKISGEPSFMLFLGTGDTLDNYEEISKAEYNRILAEKEKTE